MALSDPIHFTGVRSDGTVGSASHAIHCSMDDALDLLAIASKDYSIAEPHIAAALHQASDPEAP